MKMTNVIILVVLAILVAGGGGFYGGITYQKGKQPKGLTFTTRGNFNGPRQFNVNGRVRGDFGGTVRGEVTAINGSTVTVKQTDGSSKLVIVSSSTPVTNTVDATVADVTVGKTVMIIGTTNSDGSVTATDVQLNPSVRGVGQPDITPPPAQ